MCNISDIVGQFRLYDFGSLLVVASVGVLMHYLLTCLKYEYDLKPEYINQYYGSIRLNLFIGMFLLTVISLIIFHNDIIIKDNLIIMFLIGYISDDFFRRLPGK